MTYNVQASETSTNSSRCGPPNWFFVVLLSTLLAFGAAYNASAQTVERLESPNARAGGFYGFSVDFDAASGNFMVGAIREPTTDRGRVYLYGTSPSTPVFLRTELVPVSTVNNGSDYGRSVAVGTSVFGTSYFIGAPLDDNESLAGSTVQDTGSWTRFEFLSGSYSRVRTYELGSRDQARRLLGIGLALDGTTLAAGASTSADSFSPGGRVHIRNLTGVTSGSNGATIASPSPQENAQFGRGLALDGNRLVITALNYDDGGLTNRGNAYSFTRDPSTSTWSQEQQLVPTGLTDGAQYGRAVALAGDVAFISASAQDVGATPDAGAVYVWTRDPATGTWSHTQTLTAATPETDAIYGYALSYDTSTSTLYVGAPREDISSPSAVTDAGVVYAYQQDGGGTWQEQFRFASDTPQSGALFGASLSAGADKLVVGAYSEDVSDGAGGTIADAGAVYVYDMVSALPVELAGFEARLQGTTAHLQWRTLSETDNAGFHVEHRAPGGRFQDVDFVPGAGTTSEPQSYSIRMDDLSSGTHAFRLRQVDLDGTATRSDAITVEVRTPAGVSPVWPNPSRGLAQAEVTVGAPGRVQAAVYDLLGRRVLTVHDGLAQPDAPVALQIATDALPSGMYLLRVQTPQETTMRRFTVVR
ncbi:MAG: T9SS type A sorting domain-containing protein [Longimonas sp.]|uniref:T9SS type A sorting domain-containing protein n=1 Tax=Longimonas sp. TaxID=2039626 RepID=UPI003974BA8F